MEGDCKLESFSALLTIDVVHNFAKSAFHITYEKVSNEAITYTSTTAVHAKVWKLLALSTVAGSASVIPEIAEWNVGSHF